MTPAFYQIKERSLRDLSRDIYNLIKSIIVSIHNFLVWAHNKILDPELSISWKILWLGIGVIFVLVLVLTVYAKVRKLRRHKKAPTTKPEQKPVSLKQVDQPETLACWKCQQSVPVEEYSGHVDKCVLQKPQFRV